MGHINPARYSAVLSPRRRRPFHRVAPLMCVVVAAAVLAPGCAAPETVHLPRADGSFNPPVVISADARRDAAALAVADQHLSDADWRILEKLGPRPIWERIEGARKRVDVVRDAAPPAPGAATPINGGSIDPRSLGDQPNAIIPPPIPPAPPDESTLPVTIRRIDDGRLRIIWTLRNYGGTTVTSKRDDYTSRRDVDIKPADLSPLVAIVAAELGDAGVCAPLPAENTLVITCTDAMRPRVIEVLARLDVAPRQVEINAKIFEVSHDFDFQQGTELILNHISANGSQTGTSIFSAKRFLDAYVKGASGGAPVQGSVLKLMQVFEDAGVSVDVSFQLLSESGLIQVVSAPRMTVAVGKTGYMLAGQELPIQSANITNGVLQTATRYKPVGVQLYITPQAASDRTVKLHTISIVSAISGFAPLPTMTGSAGFNEQFINPVIDSREAETAVTVGDGDTLVISGLRMVRTTTRENKIPWLGDFPGIEWMFKNHRSQQKMTDLYFFVTPHLLPVSSTAAAE